MMFFLRLKIFNQKFGPTSDLDQIVYVINAWPFYHLKTIFPYILILEKINIQLRKFQIIVVFSQTQKIRLTITRGRCFRNYVNFLNVHEGLYPRNID